MTRIDSVDRRPALPRPRLGSCLASQHFRFATHLGIGILALAVLPTVAAQGPQLAYSFEDGLDGFVPNGGGITVTQDSIGATEGTSSLKVDIVQPATFVGALAEEFDPEIIGNPPGIDYFLMDLTVTEAFAGTFANLGVAAFGVSQPDYPGGQQTGLQVQFIDNEMPLGDLEVGTHLNFRMDLTDGNFHPLTFAFPVAFNDVFGELGSGPDDLILTGFQFYINKSADAPITVYLDNIRAGMSVDGDYNQDGVVNLADFTIWRDNLGLQDVATVAEGDGDGDGSVTAADYTYWKERFGGSPTALSANTNAVPEPLSVVLLGLAALGFCGWRRGGCPVLGID